MFTQNYIDFTRARMLAPAYNTEVKLKSIAGGNIYARMDTSGRMDLGHALKYGKCMSLPGTVQGTSSTDLQIEYGVFFGRGSTPPSLSDYTLEDVITSGLSVTAGDLTMSNGQNGGHELFNTFIVKNTTDAPISISEMGLFCPMIRNYTTGGWYHFIVLFERQVLASPITIPAGEAKVITYKITFNQAQ